MNAITETKTVIEESTIKLSKVEKKSGKRIGYYYIIIKSLKESIKNDVVKCFFIKGLTNFGFCVIKEGSYGESKDKQGRDIKDRLIWQQKLHAQLQNLVRIPRLLDAFEENNNFYLVIQHVKGESLQTVLKKKQGPLKTLYAQTTIKNWLLIEYFRQIAELLNTLHKNNYVHRDVTPANFIVATRDQVYAIDLELSYPLDNPLMPPFQLGTFGYMSPQQKAQKTPTKQDDIFSLGIIILEGLTGISGLKFADCSPENISSKIDFLIEDKAIAELLKQCLHPEAEKRPEMDQVKTILEKYKNDLKSGSVRHQTNPLEKHTEEDIKTTIQNTINTLSTVLFADEKQGWFSANIHTEDNNEKNKFSKGWYASFYIGVGGILYTISNALNKGFDIESNRPFINIGLKLIEEKYLLKIDKKNPSLLYGSSGIALSLSNAIHSQLIPAEPHHINWIRDLLNIENQNTDLSYGIAGQGLAALSCSTFISPEAEYIQTSRFASRLSSLQQADGSWKRAEFEEYNKKNYTVGKGCAGIILFLLEYIKKYQDANITLTASKGLQWLMDQATTRKAFLYWTSESNKELKYNILEGNAGIALVFLKAYEVLGDRRYKNIAQKALMCIHPQILHSNLSQSHGLSGLGEVYLKAFTVLKEDVWMERAGWIAQLIMRLKKDDSKYGNYWLVDMEKRPVANYMHGNSGIINFLLNYCNNINSISSTISFL